MPLNRPVLALEAKPSTVQFARAWVDDVCRRIERVDLVESAQLAVSELVTNALLHGAPQFGIRLRGTRSHPRVEVLDGSQEPPLLPRTTDPDDLLNTFGRGLSIVAACARAWGAVIEPSGKFVWFEPSEDLLDDPSEGRITDLRVKPEPPLDDGVTVALRDVPTAGALALRRRYFDLRRELRLLQLAHEGDYPFAHEILANFAEFEHEYPTGVTIAARHARRDDRDSFDVEARVRPEAANVFERMKDTFARADEFAESENLLSLAHPPEERALQAWFLDQLVKQIEGGSPAPYDGPR